MGPFRIGFCLFFLYSTLCFSKPTYVRCAAFRVLANSFQILTPEDVASVFAQTKTDLTLAGVKFHPTADYDAFLQTVMLESGEWTEAEAAQFRIVPLLQIDGTEPASKNASPIQPALTHPGLPETIKYLSDHGYRLVVDPTLSIETQDLNSPAYHRPYGKIIAITATTKWAELVHEVEHAKNNIEFWENDGVKKIRLLAALGDKALFDAVRRSNPRLARAAELALKGFDRLGVDETLATEAQERVLKQAGFSRFGTDRMGIQRYRLQHQIESLETIPEDRRNGAQALLLQKLKRDVRFLDIIDDTKLYTQLGVSLVARAAFPAAAGAATTAYLSLCDYENNPACEPALLVRKKTGEWLSIRPSELFSPTASNGGSKSLHGL